MQDIYVFEKIKNLQKTLKYEGNWFELICPDGSVYYIGEKTPSVYLKQGDNAYFVGYTRDNYIDILTKMVEHNLPYSKELMLEAQNGRLKEMVKSKRKTFYISVSFKEN